MKMNAGGTRITFECPRYKFHTCTMMIMIIDGYILLYNIDDYDYYDDYDDTV